MEWIPITDEANVTVLSDQNDVCPWAFYGLI